MKHYLATAEATIHRMIESLHKLFLFCKSRNDQIETLKSKRNDLDTKNPEYSEIREEKRESMKMYLRAAIVFLSVCIDLLLMYAGMTILCNIFNLPSILKFLAPAFLILAEIVISYFQIINSRSGERVSWFVGNVQYFLIFILIGFTALVILFSAQSYNPSTDGASFWSFIAGTLLVQLALLIASIMLHVWVIKNAEELGEAFAFFSYSLHRKQLTKQIDKIENDNKNIYLPTFIRDTQKFVQKMEIFKRQYPDSDANFEKAMPTDLSKAINKVMGKAVFPISVEIV